MKPKYWNKGILYLSKKDPVLKDLIIKYPKESLLINSNYFSLIIKLEVSRGFQYTYKR